MGRYWMMVAQRDLIKHLGTSESPENGPDVDAAKTVHSLAHGQPAAEPAELRLGRAAPAVRVRRIPTGPRR